MKKLMLLSMMMGIVLLAMVAQGQQVNLEWDANSEPDLIGYNLYQADAATGPWDKVNVDVITNPAYSIDYTEPVESDRYYYVTATDGPNESEPSNIVATRVDTVAPANPGMLRITIEGSVQLIVNGPVTVRK